MHVVYKITDTQPFVAGGSLDFKKFIMKKRRGRERDLCVNDSIQGRVRSGNFFIFFFVKKKKTNLNKKK